MDATCHDGMCGKCHAGKWIVFGLILIVNQLYLKWDVWVVIGMLVVLKGIMKLALHASSPGQAEMKKGKK